jgi:hypothetical protein
MVLQLKYCRCIIHIVCIAVRKAECFSFASNSTASTVRRRLSITSIIVLSEHCNFCTFYRLIGRGVDVFIVAEDHQTSTNVAAIVVPIVLVCFGALAAVIIGMLHLQMH